MNYLISSGNTVTLAVGQTYTVKDNEVYINEQLYRKSDLEIVMSDNYETAESTDVKVGIRLRDGIKNLPASMVNYANWTIDTVVQTALGTLVENINTIIS